MKKLFYISFLFCCFLFSYQFTFPQTTRSIYPIIFVHGLNSDNTLWDTTINQLSNVFWKDSNNIFYAVLNAAPGTNIKGADNILGTGDDDVLFHFSNNNNQLSDGDLFAVNFKNFWNENQSDPQLLTGSTAVPGSNESGSSQSSIYKQGYALREAIKAVLKATGAEKVILVGHSMGGLAIREYLQRRNNQSEGSKHTWWVDTLDEESGHKVAKVVTIGTPHRGSNLLVPGLLRPYINIDESSEAVRDLRFYDSSSPDIFSGVYLFGGNENGIKIYDPAATPKGFYNTDVNCNGIVDSIVGLNSGNDGSEFNPGIPLPANLGYTYIVSSFGGSSDLFVDVSRQWLYNSGNLPVPLELSDTLRTNRPHVRIFSTPSEADDYYSIVHGIDEPNFPDLAYALMTGKVYNGLATIQTNNIPVDYDWYKTNIDGNTILILFSPSGTGGGRIDFYKSKPSSNYDSDMFMNFYGSEPVSFFPQVSLSPGEYYIRVQHSNVSPDDWKTPYSLSILDSLPLIPVELSLFTGVVNSDNITLKWSTSTETNNKGFEIERSLSSTPSPEEGAIGNSPSLGSLPTGQKGGQGVGWEKVGFVTAKGTTTQLSQYTFYDEFKNTSFKGLVRYRLKQIDFSGDFYYSHEIKFDVDFMPKEFDLFQNYPNPFNPATTIKYTLPEESNVNLTVFNSLGQKVLDLVSNVLLSGYQEVSWNANNCASGIYLVKLSVITSASQKYFTKTIKMILIR